MRKCIKDSLGYCILSSLEFFGDPFILYGITRNGFTREVCSEETITFQSAKCINFFLQLILLQNSLGNIGCSLLAGSHMRREVMVSISYYIFFFIFFYQFFLIFIEIEIARKFFNKINLKFSFEDLNK